MMGASSLFMGKGDDSFVGTTQVLAINHSAQASQLEDTQKAGEEWANRYYRIRTPLKVGCRVMYRFTMTGYSYGEGKPIDCVWVGYLYTSQLEPIKTFTECKYISGAEASTYIEDGHLYLKLGPISRYCNAFELYYQGHFQNATLGLQGDQYSVTATPK